jgi:hypothetical protein
MAGVLGRIAAGLVIIAAMTAAAMAQSPPSELRVVTRVLPPAPSGQRLA